jgi:hypothetical protein
MEFFLLPCKKAQKVNMFEYEINVYKTVRKGFSLPTELHYATANLHNAIQMKRH